MPGFLPLSVLLSGHLVEPALPTSCPSLLTYEQPGPLPATAIPQAQGCHFLGRSAPSGEGIPLKELPPATRLDHVPPNHSHLWGGESPLS